VAPEDVGHRTRGADLLSGIAGYLAGLAPWIYLPLRAGKTIVDFAAAGTPRDLFFTVTGLSFSSHLGGGEPGETAQQVGGLLATVPFEVGWPCALLAVAGLLSLLRSGVRGP